MMPAVNGHSASRSPIKLLDPKEFMEFGYLQEVNRKFFHPLGLSLIVDVDSDSGSVTLSSIKDDRDDLEGVIFDTEKMESAKFLEKAVRVHEEFKKRAEVREKALGYVIQPLPEKT